MRLRQRDLKPYTVKKHGTFKDADGTKYTGYEKEGRAIKANIQPAGGKMLSEIYGLRLAYMLTMYCQKGTELSENDGVCVCVDESQDPDYKIVAIRPWNTHIVADLEKVKQ
ncbi:conserved protein of unknown function [Tepidanaerobacter acetatoxydans Re1]|uniref:Phage protein n=1 Tax=Tepidanaerobacter acetatoxydans (strain DSM 21804 / JCM 16047 / Re1) TaxID=1209989 RepID=F4LSD8_TEPAE|nr:hypothetical protein [Tepidanaerobacter acetatoxydans]AEE91204.1 hypothetical protein TepRe1_1056 [Tepidanaerobacter acetatoxydans Re1]CCP25875.1 conserved protein of unknown function [Tepidanaerobacter acetatoxydans Re1]